MQYIKSFASNLGIQDLSSPELASNLDEQDELKSLRSNFFIPKVANYNEKGGRLINDFPQFLFLLQHPILMMKACISVATHSGGNRNQSLPSSNNNCTNGKHKGLRDTSLILTTGSESMNLFFPPCQKSLAPTKGRFAL